MTRDSAYGKMHSMLPSAVADSFVPVRDPELSRKFYTDLGFTTNWSNDQIAELQIGAFRFLLQTFYVPEHAGNFMMSLTVDDADAWWEHIQRQQLPHKYPGIVCKPPAMQPWGIRVLYLSDPTGVLWHITDNRKSNCATWAGSVPIWLRYRSTADKREVAARLFRRASS